MYTRSVFMNCLCVIYLSLKQSSCAFNKEDRGAEMSGSVSIKSGSESDLQAAVAYVGPVAVAVDASSRAFRVCVCVFVRVSVCVIVNVCVCVRMWVCV